MMKSMTGYGKGEADNEGRRFAVEVRSVNHRYSDISLRLPRQYASLEGKIKKVVGNRIYRGKVDVTLVAGLGQEGEVSVDVNEALASAYYSTLRSLKKRLGIAGDITMRDLISIPNVITLKEVALDIEKDWPLIETATKRSLDALDDMKGAEGAALAVEISGRLERIAGAKEEVAKRGPQVVEFYKEKLAERVGSLGYELDQGRLAQEVAFFADKCDISEELVRLSSHLEQFRLISASPEPAGRKLDFLIQEINREINTIGSKGNDATISHKVVEMKAELEKIREQVQNIE